MLACALLGGCASGGSAGRNGLQPVLAVEPEEFPLGGTREVRVVYRLHNGSGKVAGFEFPTSQRFEVVLENSRGERLFLWSEDRLFEAVPSRVTLNAGERLQFEAMVPTRDLAAGSDYAVAAGLPGYAETVATAPLRPR